LFKQNALKAPLNKEQAADVKVIAQVIGEYLQTAEGFDPIVGHELIELANSDKISTPDPFMAGLEILNEELSIGADHLAYDNIESLNNILKSMGKPVKHLLKIGKKGFDAYGINFEEGILEQAKEQGKKDGKNLVKTAILVIKFLFGVTIAGKIGALSYLILNFPTKFSWLIPLLQALGFML